jgi:hypothetical protein
MFALRTFERVRAELRLVDKQGAAYIMNIFCEEQNSL